MRMFRPPKAGFATAAFAIALFPWTTRASDSPAAQRARGDELYAHGQVSDARMAYQSALAVEPGSPVTLCRLARVESEMSRDAKGEERRQLLADAVEYARAAVKAAPDFANGHVWLAVALGLQARDEGPRTRLALAREIKSEVDRGIALDPTNGRAHRERGIWNRNQSRRGLVDRAITRAVLADAPKGASMENAVRDLQKAVELEPGDVESRLELGRTYVMLRSHADARRELEKTVTLPLATTRDARCQAEAKELLAKLPKRD